MPDFDVLNAKLKLLQDQFDGTSQRALINEIAREAKKDAENELDSDLGSDRRFSGWKRVRLGVGYDLLSDHEAKIMPRPSGPWSVLDGGRKNRTAIPKRGRGNKILRTPYGPRTYSRSHPLYIGGTRGKNTWSNAMTKVERETPRRIHRHVQTTLARIF